jgi:hypothetical protein
MPRSLHAARYRRPPAPRRVPAILATVLGALLAYGVVAAAPPTAGEILDKVDDLFRETSSHGRATMTIAAAHWTRTLTLEFWSKGTERSLVRILAPEKEKGTATLKVGTDMWNFLPKVKRVVKLPSSMLSASWMGSHFTNDDLVRESRMSEDYTSAIGFTGDRDGIAVIEVTAIPKPAAPVVWGKVVVRVRADDLLPVRAEYYDEQQQLARTMTWSEIGTLGGRRLPTLITIVPAAAASESTRVRWDAIEFDVDVPDDFFSLRELQR